MTKEHEAQIRDEIEVARWRGEWDRDEEEIIGECENCGDPICEADENVIGVLDAELRPHLICDACSKEMSAGDLFELCGHYWTVGGWRDVSATLGQHAAECRKIRRGA